MSRLAAVAVGRPTFDLDEARRRVDAVAAVVAGHHGLVAPLGAVRTESGTWDIPDCDAILVLQATFTDSTLPVSLLASAPSVPVVLWGFPEARTGRRLLLNSLCGINLTAAALRSQGLDVRYLYAHPSDPDVLVRLGAALAGPAVAVRRAPPAPVDGPDLVEALGSTVVGLIGDHPDGFDPCGFEPAELNAAGGIRVDRVELDDLFGRARSLPPIPFPDGADRLDAGGVEATARLGTAMADLATERGWGAVATRCWPECFTEFGGAACAAMGRLSDQGVPGVCEADVFGAATAVVLGAASGNPVLVADLVDVADDGTVAFWHCGIAPPSMAHPDDPVGYTVHPNRRLPLLHEFRLRPGRVTVARLNRSGGTLRLAVGGGEILDRPRPYAGTCAVVRPDTPAGDLLDTVITEGLDHHYGITHGDVRGEMIGLARTLGLDVVVL